MKAIVDTADVNLMVRSQLKCYVFDHIDFTERGCLNQGWANAYPYRPHIQMLLAGGTYVSLCKIK